MGGWTFDKTIQIGEILALFAAAWTILKGGLGLRDAARDFRRLIEDIQGEITKLDNRVTFLERERFTDGERRTGQERRSKR